MPCPVRAHGARLDGRPAAVHGPDQLRERGSRRRDPLPRRGAGRERGAHRRAEPARDLPDPGARAGAAGRCGARGDPREPRPRHRADRAGRASHAGREAALDRSGARREGVPDPAPAGSGHADRPARLHPRRGRRHAPQAGGEQDGPARGRAALQLRADHGPRREHRALPRSAAAARRQNRRRSGPAYLRVSAQARQRRRAGHHPGAGVRRHRGGGADAAARAGARRAQPVERADRIPPSGNRIAPGARPNGSTVRGRARGHPGPRGGGERPGPGPGTRGADHDRSGPSDQLTRDPYRAAKLLGAPGDDRATRRPSPASPLGSADRRGDPRPGQPVRHQLATLDAAGRFGRLDPWDRHRGRPAELRRYAAAGLPRPGRAGRQPRQLERAGHPAGARVAHQRARAVDAAGAGTEQRGGAHPGGKRGAVRVLHLQRPDGGAEHRRAVSQRGHAADGRPHRQQRRLRHVPRAAGGERAVRHDDRRGAERPRDYHARSGDERDREERAHDRDRRVDRGNDPGDRVRRADPQGRSDPGLSLQESQHQPAANRARDLPHALRRVHRRAGGLAAAAGTGAVAEHEAGHRQHDAAASPEAVTDPLLSPEAPPPAPQAEPPRTAADLRAAAAGPLAQQLSPKYLEEHCLLPLAIADGGALVVAAGLPLDPTVIDELCWTFERQVRLVEAPAAEIHAAILSAQSEAAPERQAGDLRGGDLVVPADEEETTDDLRALANQAPVIKLVNVLILEALRARASDVHLEAGAEGLLAQDGRIRLRLSDRELDMRVSITPTLHGESVVLRVLDRGAGVRDLAELGMPGPVLDQFEHLIRQPHGILLVTGPTGSGKTTTLYGALDRLNQPGVKIVTVEDPVEYQVAGVTQIPVNPKIGLTFAAALRSILRHDPDIIMVGEMRDRETAEIAIQAALTGHLVFSTLHTNDAPSGVTRMVDMGIEPYLVAATVLGILGQRLVRAVCDSCAEDFRPPPDVVAQAAAGQPDIPKPRFRRGRAGGCEVCSGTGYRGRTGLYELMRMSDELRARVVKNAPLAEIQALAQARGMAPLRAAGWAQACAGGTTLEEVLRVTRDEVLG